ncbi:hypothetical protein CYMTET_56602 [Cymbomonas tetramitiformis]|uniref:Uncharacterized protein n=1 Tax=Cymbomonas tetramitiformis TaxID=36881 RepID=A0AAE0EM53_9CHLO|nr:hypothetical protein CYMTET_56602 [Cymbomonas tetramitiformis]
MSVAYSESSNLVEITEAPTTTDDKSFDLSAAQILQSVAVFILAGLFEIGGGWLVWSAIRENKPWWWALLGSIVLVGYGFLPTLQPVDDFGRVYAIYGGYFIALSFVWGYAVDGMRVDTGDIIGSVVAFAGVLIIFFWPR